ncbi:Hypp951 [Branchiostoma lanceolatum]|uniref:Hypp951 protein n=1 Tax=Branchiostoma lanceolatum TaxID=7740 RepID=A0A8K0EKZ5_BRALA|nr:Hypp951 [Branchiostoma lanceolatum]
MNAPCFISGARTGLRLVQIQALTQKVGGGSDAGSRRPDHTRAETTSHTSPYRLREKQRVSSTLHTGVKLVDSGAV